LRIWGEPTVLAAWASAGARASKGARSSCDQVMPDPIVNSPDVGS